jgi:hypothetical protein
VVTADVPVAREPGSTFYARFGDVFAFSCILVALAGLLRDGFRVSSNEG